MTAKPYLPPTPLDDDSVVITAIETVQPRDLFPGLLLVRIHTEDGLIGHGEIGTNFGHLVSNHGLVDAGRNRVSKRM